MVWVIKATGVVPALLGAAAWAGSRDLDEELPRTVRKKRSILPLP